jgi:dihydroorotase
MGSSTGDLLMDDLSSLHAIYALANAHNLIIALHAEDELIIQQNLALYKNSTNYADHSKVRSIEAAVTAISLVIELAKLYKVPSYILHVSSQKEIELIALAKSKNIPIYAETCPHYLFLDDTSYQTLNGKAKMNPPLRNKNEQKYLWQALNDGVIDTVASDHAPHTLEEKQQPLCKCPSGVPGIETTLPLMISAYLDKKISLNRIIELLHSKAKEIFNLPNNDDLIFIDIKNYRKVNEQELHTKAKWSPFVGLNLTGWPQYVYTGGRFIDLSKL